MMENKPNNCLVCKEYVKTKISIDGVDFNACGLTGWLIKAEFAEESAVCKE